MSSWLSLSLPNPFKITHDHSPPQSPTSPAGDLSVLTQSITRQLRGVASFLAPPPKPHSDEPSSPSSSQTLTGIKSDFSEIGDSFKTSLSRLSTNKAVTNISRLASNLLQFGNQQDGDEEEEEEEYEDAVGITDEVIGFVGEISLSPELWTDFPLSLNKEFGISDVQKDHASAIEQLVPSLTALRKRTCSYLNEGQFWIIYFALLISRLNDDDSKLLSTPEIVEVRETLLETLKSKHNSAVEVSGEHESRSVTEAGVEVNNRQEMKHPSSNNKLPSDNFYAPMRIITQDQENSESSSGEEDDNTGTHIDKWSTQIETDDDASVSDLEEEDYNVATRMSGFGPALSSSVSCSSQSNETRCSSSEWVHLKENSRSLELKDCVSSVDEKDSESEGSNDWLTVDQTDSDYD